MDVTSTAAASTAPVNKNTQPPVQNNTTPGPKDAELQAIQNEISQISEAVKNSKIPPLQQDTVSFNKPAEKPSEQAINREIVNMTTPSSPLETKDTAPADPAKKDTPAA